MLIEQYSFSMYFWIEIHIRSQEITQENSFSSYLYFIVFYCKKSCRDSRKSLLNSHKDLEQQKNTKDF